MFFPRSTRNKWRFAWDVQEIEPQRVTEVIGHSVNTVEVIHYSGAPSTAVRVSDGESVFAYSGDTEWIDALVPIADGADLFIVECYAYSGNPPGHLTWAHSDAAPERAGAPNASCSTHMNPTMLERLRRSACRGCSGGREEPAPRWSSNGVGLPFKARDAGSTYPSACRPFSAPRHRTDRPARSPAGSRRSCALRQGRWRGPCASNRPRSQNRTCPAVMVL